MYVFYPTVSGKNLKKAEMLTWKQKLFSKSRGLRVQNRVGEIVDNILFSPLYY
jgi:hypothetical protein